MTQRVYHGSITPDDFTQDLLSTFNRGNYIAQEIGNGDSAAIQIATRFMVSSGGQTSISVIMQKIEDGVLIKLGQQAWLGVAASLSQTLFATLRNPFNLIGRLDDVAQDFEHIQLTEKIWQTIDQTAKAHAASYEISNRLRRLTCDYCETANTVGEPNCIACGAPLGGAHPSACPNCGYVVTKQELLCPNCGKALLNP
jgi:predicted RNA-binding Zn-ribbon protein involved in translation (DUF1610 family)